MHTKRIQGRGAASHLAMERQTACRLASCPFLCGLRYAFTHGPWYVLAFPLLPGGTLQVQLDERASATCGLPMEEVRWVGAQLALGLGFMHSLGLLHRDVKPSNILLRHDGYLVLADFGLTANLADAPPPATRTGTRGYWAPEVVLKEPQGVAADWWSYGVVLWLAWRGRHPFHQRWATRNAAENASLPQPIPDAVFSDTIDPREPASLVNALGEALSSQVHMAPVPHAQRCDRVSPHMRSITCFMHHAAYVIPHATRHVHL